MSSSSSGASGPRAKCDQVIFEAIAKAAEIIVYARSPTLHATPILSARFNLQVPEIPEIRQSLQHHRHSLHLPLRLDVYANHVLVERWSLEYLQQQSQPLFGDPIVQLRQVCKKLVIWLRTLYCWTRMLPAFTSRGQDLHYRLEVCEGSVSVPHFVGVSSKEVPTPYGLLLWKVWYAPHVQKPTTKPIPIQIENNQLISSPSPIANVAKSAPSRDNFSLPNSKEYSVNQHNNNQYKNGNYAQAGSFDRRALLLKKTQSNVEDHSNEYEDNHYRTHTRSHSSLSHRAALHDPPTYAYNNHTRAVPMMGHQNPTNNKTTATPSQAATPTHATTSASPHLVSATPPAMTPALLSSTPPTLGFLFPPAMMMRSNNNSNYSTTANTPPFSNLPRQLSKPEELCTLMPTTTEQQQQQQFLPCSLDLLHSSPFKTNASAFSSLGGVESDWLRQSSMAAYDDDYYHDTSNHANYDEDGNLNNNNDGSGDNDDAYDDEDDMPFAVDVEPSSGDDFLGGTAGGAMMMHHHLTSSSVSSKKVVLSILETDTAQDLSTLSLQLQEFKTFGARLDQ